MEARLCRYCQKSFEPSKYRPDQAVCVDAICQRRRRTEYHRDKIAADSDYRQVCLDSPRKWRTSHPGYWKQYREGHPNAVERNRVRQRQRDEQRRLRDLANNNHLALPPILPHKRGAPPSVCGRETAMG